MSGNLPELSPVTLRPDSVNFTRRNLLPHDWAIAVLLFCLTAFCVSIAGISYTTGDLRFLVSLSLIFIHPEMIFQGLLFSIPLISILLAHEIGHFFACRYYGMNCTPPYFIPMPVPLTGTMGAFIRIRSPFINKRALFDVGIAGPLAGFAILVPFLCIGIGLSNVIPKGIFSSGNLAFGEPLIFRILAILILGYSPDTQDMIAHPVANAAWVGLLVTSLNLLPVWQLDGGHIAYAMFGRSRQKHLSMAGIIFLIVLTLWEWKTPSYLLFAVVLLIFGWRTRFYHPRTLYEEEPLGKGRILMGYLALLILILSFIPVPISFI